MSVITVQIWACDSCKKESRGRIPYGWFILSKRTTAHPTGANDKRDICSLSCLIKAETNTPATYTEARRTITEITGP